MTKEQMQSKIRSILSHRINGLEIYACLKKGEEYRLKPLRATDKLINKANEMITCAIEKAYLKDEIEYDSSDNIADNRKCLYEVLQDEKYHPFDFLNSYKEFSEVFSDLDRKPLLGFFFRLNLNDEYFWAYQQVYSVTKIDRSKHIFAFFSNNTFESIDKDLLQIDARVDLLVIDNSIVTANVELLQRSFLFERYIRREATETLIKIKKMNIVQGFSKFLNFEKKRTNAKKLLKAKNSKVLSMKRNDLLNGLKKHPRYSAVFEFSNDDFIRIKSQKDADAFIKMLNDDIVRSELTGQEYDSNSKSILDPEKWTRVKR